MVNVPSNLDTLVTTLPRLPSEAGLVQVKLKRKLQYKGHSIYQCINPSSVQKGLQYLFGNNMLNADIKQHKNWIKQCLKWIKICPDSNPFNEAEDHEQFVSLNEDTDDQGDPHRSEGKQLDPHEEDQHSKSTEASSFQNQDDGYSLIQSIKGSYPYWERTLSDLNAMVRQLGIPTWFLTLTAADLRCPETIQVIA